MNLQIIDDNNTRATRRSQISGKMNTMDIPLNVDEFAKLIPKNRPHVQDLFPQLSAEHREFLISGITPKEWEDMFGEEE